MAAVMVLMCVGIAAQAEVWDLADDFSIENGNPNGAWSYGWAPTDFSAFYLEPNSSYTAFGGSPIWYGVASIWKNTTTVDADFVPVGWVALHPGEGEQPSIARWTAPAEVSGSATVAGQFLPGDGGHMQVAVIKNGSQIWQAGDAGTFNLVTDVSPGDTVDFAVYGGYYSGSTPLDATINTTVPEPSGLALLSGAAGLCGFALRRRKIKEVKKI